MWSRVRHAFFCLFVFYVENSSKEANHHPKTCGTPLFSLSGLTLTLLGLNCHRVFPPGKEDHLSTLLRRILQRESNKLMCHWTNTPPSRYNLWHKAQNSRPAHESGNNVTTIYNTLSSSKGMKKAEKLVVKRKGKIRRNWLGIAHVILMTTLQYSLR